MNVPKDRDKLMSGKGRKPQRSVACSSPRRARLTGHRGWGQCIGPGSTEAAGSSEWVMELNSRLCWAQWHNGVEKPAAACIPETAARSKVGFQEYYFLKWSGLQYV